MIKVYEVMNLKGSVQITGGVGERRGEEGGRKRKLYKYNSQIQSLKKLTK